MSSSMGMCALFYSVTLGSSQSSAAVEQAPTVNKQSPTMNLMNRRLMRSSSTAPGLYSYMSMPGEAFKRFVFGVHAKTMRSLAEEAECGDAVSVNSWVRDGVDPNELDAYGYTPLLNASTLGRLSAAKELIKNRADVNKSGPFGFTPLHAAAQNGHRELVNFLIRNGADINAQNEDLDTPMHLALRAQRLEIVYMLLRSGANAKISGLNRKTSVQLANEMGYTDLAETLKNFNLHGIYSHSFSLPSRPIRRSLAAI